MKKPSPRTAMLTIPLLVILIQEGIILFNMSSFGLAEERPWFKRWPFYSKNADDSPLTPFNFAYNGTYVDLVLGFNEENGDYQEIASIVAQEEGHITSRLSINDKTENIVVNLPTGKVSDLLKKIMNNANIEYVEPNWKVTIDATPNDPSFTNQWGPAKIEANHAWNTQKGDGTTLVAVVDTGIYYGHPDLRANYAALGYDWVNNDPDPVDDHGHGTHCAGIIAATLNNSIGIAGIAQVRIMAEKALAYNGIGYDDDLANAIVHAANQGAKIISCSWGSSEDSQLIHEAIKYATDKGALVVTAAGNSGTSSKNYPAAYPEVIAVTATDERDRLATFSTYGDWVDISAPGTSIYSTYLWNTYVSMSGTSMACPHVAGVAALIKSQYPTMNNEQIRNQLFATADDLGSPGFDIYYGHGRVNARKAVELTVSLTGSKILNAPANTVYFMYTNPTPNMTAEAAYDAIANGIIYGLATNAQKQSFTSTGHLMLESGKLNATAVTNATVVILGGPYPQKTVRYYENAGLTPLKFAMNATHYKFVTQNNRTVAEISKTTANSGHEDMFVVEVLQDKTNLIVIMYGFTWKGTWASGTYFKEVAAKNLNNYTEEYYVFHWIDDKQFDGVPQSIEIHQENPA